LTIDLEMGKRRHDKGVLGGERRLGGQEREPGGQGEEGHVVQHRPVEVYGPVAAVLLGHLGSQVTPDAASAEEVLGDCGGIKSLIVVAFAALLLVAAFFAFAAFFALFFFFSRFSLDRANGLFHFFADAYRSQNVLAVDSIVEVGVAAFFRELVLDVGAVSGVAGRTRYHAKGVRPGLAELLDVPDDADERLVVGVRLVADELPDVERLDLVEEHGQAPALLPNFRQHLLEGGFRRDAHVRAQ
jgi:hypothetical protein